MLLLFINRCLIQDSDNPRRAFLEAGEGGGEEGGKGEGEEGERVGGTSFFFLLSLFFHLSHGAFSMQFDSIRLLAFISR